MNHPRIYPNLRTYLKETRTTQLALLKRLADLGFPMSQGKLNKIVNGKLEPTLLEALAISAECNIPAESLSREAQTAIKSE